MHRHKFCEAEVLICNGSSPQLNCGYLTSEAVASLLQYSLVCTYSCLSVSLSISLCVLAFFGSVKPKFRYANFHQNLPAGKVTDTYHESHQHKPFRHVEMSATKSVTSP